MPFWQGTVVVEFDIGQTRVSKASYMKKYTMTFDIIEFRRLRGFVPPGHSQMQQGLEAPPSTSIPNNADVYQTARLRQALET